MQDDTDPWLWLEEVLGERALDWVRQRNAETEAQLQALPRYAPMREAIQAILDSREQIPTISRRGEHVYNLWRDADHPRGLWRRTTLEEYRTDAPRWDVLLDLDALGRLEGENWVWAGARALGPAYRRVLVSLSRGGADATVVREFDLDRREFVAGGFELPEAKSAVTWIDEDTVYAATDIGPDALTDSGYPRTIRRWRRGQPPAEAPVVFRGDASDVMVVVDVDPTPGYQRTTFTRLLDFYRTRDHLLAGDGRLVALDKPEDAEATFWREWLMLSLRSDWVVGGTTWPSGSLLATPAADFLAGRPTYAALFTPTPTRSLAGWTATRTTVVLDVLDEVASRLEEWRHGPGGWTRRDVQAPHPGTLGVSAMQDVHREPDPLAEALLVNYTDFLTPDSLMLGQAGRDGLEVLKSRPRHFDAAGMRVEQRHARSRDGTQVPYFIVWPARPRDDGRNPTVLYGYGGFEIPMQPSYSGTIGSQWLAGGGVHVLANIRGGGEFGPAWHQAALRSQRQNAFDDFAAVAEDLIARGVTRAEHLGIEGGSNGGLLVGTVMLQRPELFRAVVCQVPLLDMRRFHLLLAGASWMAEYGNPDDPDDWAFIARYSPYQNVRADQALPAVLFTTSTRDDRVHPGHARKMAARMREQGHRVLYWENIEGGHGGAADNAQRAQMSALELTFLWRELAPPPA
ncbi:MAG: S9 family peptidase [Rubrivivax sp.]|nr:S9 family peptidase [Rubrivivax sp.]